jgi:hypothetical protein
MRVHRHLKHIDNTLFLINISFELEDSIIVLKNFTMHAIVEDIIGPNIVKEKLEQFDILALDNIFDILINDGVFNPHK